MLVVGFAAGCGAMAGVWAFINSKKGKASSEQVAQREETLQYINGLLADTDAVESGFRAGALSLENFKRQLGDKINIVMRALRTNMHLLDVFYVKFVEQQAHEYLRILENPERRKTGLVRPDTPPAAELPDIDRQAVAATDVGAPPPLFVADTRTPPPALKVEVEEIDDGFEPPEKETLEIDVKEPWTPSEDDAFEPKTGAGESAPVQADEPVSDSEVEELIPEQDVSVIEDDEVSFTEQADVSVIDDDEVSFTEQADVPPPDADEELFPEVAEESVSEPAAELAPEPEVLAAVAPESAPGSDEWDSMEEFEAAFEQFEVQAPPPPPKKKSAEEAMTETSSIDRSAIAAALSARQTSLPIPPPPQYISVPEPQPEEVSVPPRVSIPVSPPEEVTPPPQVSIPVSPPESAPPPQKAPEQKAEEGSDMLNGDDVVDAIDAFFSQK
jgi:hypothetical protein